MVEKNYYQEGRHKVDKYNFYQMPGYTLHIYGETKEQPLSNPNFSTTDLCKLFGPFITWNKYPERIKSTSEWGVQIKKGRHSRSGNGLLQRSIEGQHLHYLIYITVSLNKFDP